MNKKPVKILVICFILISLAYFVNGADDEYKPYLHKASVPEHPKLELYGRYKTNLFPGAATYSYGIEVPKGTNDLAPSLSVSYNSQTVKQRPSFVGAGWMLSQNLVYRDINATLNDTSDDSYKLVLDNVQYELVYFDGTYHTKIESYMKVEYLSGAPNNYGGYWRVILKDGTKYRFGYNPDSELTSNSGYGYALKWSLDLIEDAHDNKIYYSYLENPFSDDFGAVYLDEISYNNYREREIRFVYDGSLRADNRLVYEQGNKLSESRRLKDINVFINDNLVRRYNLGYSNLNAENSLFSLSAIKLYGSDNTSILHNISFEYFSDKEGYIKYDSAYMPKELFSNYEHKDFGVRLADFNNDGFVDIVKGRGATGKKEAFVNNRLNNWSNTTSFIPPMDISVSYSGSEVDNGVRFADVNNDGFVDILYGNSGAQEVYLNNGSGWNKSNMWATPVYFVDGSYIDQGARLVDLNGDGRVDILQAKYDGEHKAYLNNGSGWRDVNLSWKSPVDFIHLNQDFGVRLVDLNGDGLADMIHGDGKDCLKNAWLNNGSGWSNYPAYKPPLYFTTSSRKDNGARFADVNGDGLTDLIVDFQNSTITNKSAYINNGSGWSLSSGWKSSTPFTKDGYNIGRRLGDVNGDGFADVIVAYGNSSEEEHYTYIKNSSNAYLLKRIVNEYGGVVEIDYSASTSYNNSALGNSTLGFNMWVVGNVSQDNSLAGDFNSAGNYSYWYFGGRYDYKEQEFRGFNIVNETRPDNSFISHYFHQGDALKGKEYKTEAYNSSGSLFSKTESSYNHTFNGPYYEVFLKHTANYLYDGFSAAEITNVSYGYDDYGNVIYRNSYGDVSVAGDEKYERYVYAYNTSENMLGKVSRYSLYEDDNTSLAKETLYYYDGLSYGASPTKGELTKVSEWNDKGEDSITRFEYDDYGNVIEKIDPLGRETKYLYGLRDTSFTYADRITNALGHRTDYDYDLGTGNLLWEEKENIRRSYAYDVYGRIVKEILPYDSYYMPTKEYAYTFDGDAPEVITVSLREHNGETVDTYYYYDGFANLVQLKTEIEEDEAVVKNIFYDGLGRVKEEQNPYFEAFSNSLSTPSDTINKTYYSYDALDRVVRVVNPDTTSKVIDFNKWSITDYDENSNKHTYLLDAHGRIVNVIEYNKNPYENNREEIYNTSYQYDTNDNLIKITDNEGNEFKFSYDSLGRKIKLDDPDLGIWTYAYDPAGNLVEQNDSVGNVITLSYDKLNRILNKNSTDVNISFEYDQQYDGTLSNITMGGVSFKYSYDERMRVVKEEAYLGGSWIETGISYDSMDRIIEKRLPSTDLEYFYNKQGKVRRINDLINNASYNAFGSILNRSYDNNLVTKFSYYPSDNRLSQITTGSLQSLAYAYDDVGNIRSIRDSVQSRNYSMGYDGLDRLINTTINDDLYQYEYDSIGNIKRIVRADEAKRLIYGGLIPHAPSQIIDSTPLAGAYSAKTLATGSRNRTFEFFIVNEKLTDLTSINWTIDFGQNTVASTRQINLTSRPVMVLVQNNYTSGGSYDINISTGNDDNVFEERFGVRAKSLGLITNNRTLAFIEFIVENDVKEQLNDVRWNCSNGIGAELPFNLTGNNETMVLIGYNYSNYGTKKITCYANATDGYENKTTEFEIKGLEILNFTLTDLSTNTKRVRFNIKNHYYPLTANWEIKTDSAHAGSVSLQTDEVKNVSQDITYTTDGDKTINISVYSGSIRYSEEYKFNIEALEIDQYYRYSANKTNRIISFIVTNEWPDNLSVSWNITDPSLMNSTYLNQNDTLLVIIAENYTAEGRKDEAVNVYSDSFLSTLEDWFNIYIVEMLDLQTLSESVSSTVSELVARSDSGKQTISWKLDTGEANITSIIPIHINESDRVIILVESNYTGSGVYLTNASINTSSSKDHKGGIAIT